MPAKPPRTVVPFPSFEAAQQRAKKPDPIPHQWVCRRCKHDIGVETSTILTLTIAPVIKGTKVVGGSKQKVCAHCWQRGITTKVF